jgi:hypothetical protein
MGSEKEKNKSTRVNLVFPPAHLLPSSSLCLSVSLCPRGIQHTPPRKKELYKKEVLIPAT